MLLLMLLLLLLVVVVEEEEEEEEERQQLGSLDCLFEVAVSHTKFRLYFLAVLPPPP